MRNDLVSTVKTILEIIAVALIIMLTIGFFNTPFDDGNAVKMSGEMMDERQYVETMINEINEFTEYSLTIKETSELANNGKIVPLKMTQIYSETFDAITKQYNRISAMEVPERFKTFHVTFLRSMETQGASINEVLVYLKDKEESRLKSVESYNAKFVQEYNDAVNLFNRLLEEKKLR